jgi:hypothetical protein
VTGAFTPEDENRQAIHVAPSGKHKGPSTTRVGSLRALTHSARDDSHAAIENYSIWRALEV